MEEIGQKYIRNHLIGQHREFYAKLPYFLVATHDKSGNVKTSLLVGPPGFVAAPDAHHICVSPLNPMGSNNQDYVIGNAIGCLGIELHTRRRNRANGRIVDMGHDFLLIEVDQSFGNCPKYIQGRKLEFDATLLSSYVAEVDETPFSSLSEGQQDLLRRSDTFFIGSGYTHSPQDGEQKAASGCDASHRGGPPGFVKVLNSQLLQFPDYTGNYFFNTFGNLSKNPSTSLLFLDFMTGDLLRLDGKASINPTDTSLPGAHRSVSFVVAHVLHAKGILPLRLVGEVDASPYNPQDISSGESQKIRCISTRKEAIGIKTFEFELPILPSGQHATFLPGQFATFDMDGLGGCEVLNRTWTVSSHPSTSEITFTITVKRMGVVSSWLHKSMVEGEHILFRGFGGDFTPIQSEVDQVHASAVLLVAGGIGVTPLRSMLPEFVSAGTDTVMIYSVRTRNEAAFLSELQGMASTSNGLMKLITTVTGDHEEEDEYTGRVDKQFLERLVPDIATREIYLCGPIGFMSSVTTYLEQLGCNLEKLHQESFTF